MRLELGGSGVPEPARPINQPFRSRGDDHPIGNDDWYIVAEVAEDYPKLLVWLTEGQIVERGLRNVFSGSGARRAGKGA